MTAFTRATEEGHDMSRLRPGRRRVIPSAVDPAALLVDDVSGPHTIVALGEYCFVCDDPLEPGEVYVFVRDASRNGVAHESCAGTTDRAPV